MKTYSGNSYFLIIRILFLIIPPITIGLVIYQPNTPEKTIYGGIVLIFLFLLYFLKLLKELVFVKLNEKHMVLTYLITKTTKIIPYSKILKWDCIDGQRGSHYNIIKFEADNFLSTNKIKIDRIVDSDKFIPFIKWLKSKNEKIEITITPSDSKLLYEYYKEFENN